MADQTPHLYGGQAVIEGVMIRGRDHFGLVVRREDGSIELHHEPLSSIYNGRPRRWPLVRGFLTLVETLILGIKALQLSANMAAMDRDPEAEEGIPAWVMATTLGISARTANRYWAFARAYLFQKIYGDPADGL